MSVNVSPKIAQQLLQTMEQDLVLATRLNQLLREERTYLEQRQFPAYQKVVKEKTQLLLELDQTDNERKDLMASMGFSADRQGFMAFMDFVPASWKDKFRHTWEGLSATMNTCARLNKVNGKILAHSHNTMERLMQVIRGTQHQTAVYQADGRRSLGVNQRILATA